MTLDTDGQSVSADARPTPPAKFLVERQETPDEGWQGSAHKLTRGAWNPGLSAAEKDRRALLASVRRPLRGVRRLAVVSSKGGVGKTTTMVLLGMTLADTRTDRVVLVDANPDGGTARDRIAADNDANLSDLLAAKDEIDSFEKVREYVSLDPSRLELLAGDDDPQRSEALSDEDYRKIDAVMARHYSVILTDCGTGLLHSAMKGVLGLADDLLLIVGAEVGAARQAGRTLDWLEAHGHQDKAHNAIAVIQPATVGSVVKKGTTKAHIDKDQLRAYFASRCRTVIEIPADEHLGLGAEIELDQLQPETRLAALMLADAVVDRFATAPAAAEGR